jgi:hypothetical protein
MTGTAASSPQFIARIAGAIYLITIVTGLWGAGFVRGRLVVDGDAAITASNIQRMFDKNMLTFNPGLTSDARPHFDLELAFPVKKMKGA